MRTEGVEGGSLMSAVRERSRAFTFNLHRQKDRRLKGLYIYALLVGIVFLI